MAVLSLAYWMQHLLFNDLIIARLLCDKETKVMMSDAERPVWAKNIPTVYLCRMQQIGTMTSFLGYFKKNLPDP